MAYLAINGRIVPDTEACLSPLDRGFLYGDGLFETLRVDGKRVYFLEKHLARMRDGARFLRIPFPAEFDFPGILQELRNKNRIQGDASAKICLTRGRHRNSLFLDPPSSPTVVILVNPYQSPTPADWEKGLSVTLEQEILQNDSSSLCRIKSMNYLLYLLIRTRARDRGYEDAILTNRAREVCECTTSNLFFFRQGRLETPALSCGLLPGVLRQALMECLARAGQPVQEVRLAPEALRSCEEIFVTNSLVEILPVGRVDREAYCRRERTREVQERFQAFREEMHADQVLR